jgi:hypothetical protein
MGGTAENGFYARTGTAREASMRVLPLSLVLALCLAGSVAGGAEPLPQPDPPDVWRRMTHDDATTTSRCLGDLSDPICVVETNIACFLRGETAPRMVSKCRRIQLDPSRLSDIYSGAPPQWWHRYRVLSVQWVRQASQVTNGRGEIVYHWHQGDLRVDVDLRECFQLDGDCGDPFGSLMNYFLRRVGPSRWVLMTWEELRAPY